MEHKLINIVKQAELNAEARISKITPEILAIDGMSGAKGRHFLNNIVFDGSKYLEIGSHLGSTLCSALYNNKPEQSFNIDLHKHQQLVDHVAQFVKTPHTIITGDCYQINPIEHNIKDIDIYFFDGPHSMRDHEMALEYYIGCLADTFIFAVDDWNGVEAREGTATSIKTLGLKVLYETSLPKGGESENRDGYWNGIGVFVLQK